MEKTDPMHITVETVEKAVQSKKIDRHTGEFLIRAENKYPGLLQRAYANYLRTQKQE